MTREERIKAIRYFKGQKSTIEDRYNKIPQNSIAPRRACRLEIGYYDKAIEALEEKLCVDTNANQYNSNALNDVRQHTNALEGDLISRQEVNNLQRYRYNCGETSITCVSLTDVNELPPVTPQEPKTDKTYGWTTKHYTNEKGQRTQIDYDIYDTARITRELLEILLEADGYRKCGEE